MIEPQPRTHSERMVLAERISSRLFELHGQAVLAIGVYGSTARGQDGPYSDLEMMAIVRDDEADTHEWTAGPWKAEVNVRRLADALESAAALDDDWPLAQGEFAHVLALHDPGGFFPTLRARVFEHGAAEFEALMRDVIVGDILELVGKWRNMQARGAFAGLPSLAVKLVQHTAWLIGMANRALYSTSSEVFAEALQMPDRPEGFDALCAQVMHGDLRDPVSLIAHCESLWRGIVKWAEDHRIALVTDPLDLGA